jgi:hypothetical protein
MWVIEPLLLAPGVLTKFIHKISISFPIFDIGGEQLLHPQAGGRSGLPISNRVLRLETSTRESLKEIQELVECQLQE